MAFSDSPQIRLLPPGVVVSNGSRLYPVSTSEDFANLLDDVTGTGEIVLNSSPAFAGVPTAPTADVGTNTTQLATTAFVLANQAAPDLSDYARKSVTNTFTAGQVINAGTASTVGLIVKTATSPTANLQEWQNSTGTVLANVNSSGVGTFAGLVTSGVNSVYTYQVQANFLSDRNSGANDHSYISTVASSTHSFRVQTNAGTRVPFSIIGATPTQTANLFELMRFDGTIVSWSPDGVPAYRPASPSQITADQDNYAPTKSRFIRVSSDASRTITGLSVGQADGLEFELWNVGSYNIVLANESNNSTAANRFATVTGADLVLAPNEVACLRYDDTTDRFRAFKGLGGSASSIVTAATLVVKQISSGTTFQEWQDSAGTVKLSVNSSGEIAVPAGGFVNVNLAGSGSEFRVYYGSTNYVRASFFGVQLDNAANFQWTDTFIARNSAQGCVFTTTAATGVPIVAKGATSQSANIQEWQNSAGTALLSVGSGGNINSSGGLLYDNSQGRIGIPFIRSRATTNGQYTFIIESSGTYTGATAYIQAPLATAIPIVVKGFTSQTANLQEWQNSDGTVLTAIDSAGKLLMPNSNNCIYNEFGNLYLNTAGILKLAAQSGTSIFGGGASTIPLTVKGATSQSADLQEWQNSAGTVLSAFDSAGRLRINATTNAGALATPGASQLYVRTATNRNLGVYDYGSSTVLGALDDIGSDYTALTIVGKPLVINGSGSNIVTIIPGLVVGTIAYNPIATGVTVGAGSSASIAIGQSYSGAGTAWLTSQSDVAYTPLEIDSSTLYIGRYSSILVGIGGVSVSGQKLTVYTGTASNVGLVVKGAASQSADFFQIKDSADTTVFQFDANGGFSALGATGLPGYGTVTAGFSRFNQITNVADAGPYLTLSSTFLSVTARNATDKVLIVKGATSQSANLQQWRNSSETVLAFITSVGAPSFPFGSGADNQRLGDLAGNETATGGLNTALGNYTMNTLTSGVWNTAVGRSAMSAITSGGNNVAVGVTALLACQTASGNTALGAGALQATTGASNTGVGFSAAGSLIGGQHNVALGYGAATHLSGPGVTLTTGNRNILIGPYATTLASSTNNGIAIGMYATTSDNTFVAGSVTYPVNNVYFGSGITATTPTAYAINGTGGSGTDIAGANLVLASGKGTGNAAAGSIVFQTSDAGSTGTTLQTLATRMTITGAGKVGIGVTAPATLLHVALDNAIGDPANGVAGTAFTQFAVSGTTASTKRLMLGFDTTNNYGIIAACNVGSAWHDLYLQPYANNGIPIVSIKNSTGCVGINNTSPSAYLHVTALAAATVGAIVKGATSQSADLQQWQNSAGTALTIVDKDGNVGVGVAPSSSYPGIRVGSSVGNIYITCENPGSTGVRLFSAGVLTSIGSGHIGLAVQDGTVTCLSIRQDTGWTQIGRSLSAGSAQGQFHVLNQVYNYPAVIVQGATSQSANLQEWQNVSGTVLASMNASGSLHMSGGGDIVLNNSHYVYSLDGGGTPCIMIGMDGASNSVFRHGSTSGNAYYGIASTSNVGRIQFQTKGANVAAVDQYGAWVLTSQAAASIPLIAKGATSQSANLQEWQNSAGTVLASVNNGGAGLFTDSVTSVATTSPVYYLKEGGSTTSFAQFTSGVLYLGGGNTNKIYIGLTSTGASDNRIEFNSNTDVKIGTLSNMTSVSSTSRLKVYGSITLGERWNGGSQGDVYVSGGDAYDSNSITGARLIIRSGGADPNGQSNHAGRDLVLQGGPSIGSGAGGNVLIQTMAAGSSGSSANTYGTVVTVGNTTQNVLINSSAATVIPLVVKGYTSQSANLQEWQNSGGTVVGKVCNDGRFCIGQPATITQSALTVSNLGGSYGYAVRFEGSALFTGLIETSGTMQFDSAMTMRALNTWAITNAANIITAYCAATGGWTYFAPTASDVAFTVKGATSQSADLQQWLNSAGTVQSAVTSAGSFLIGSGQTDGGTGALLSVKTGIYTPGFSWATGGFNLTGSCGIVPGTTGVQIRIVATHGLELQNGGGVITTNSSSGISVYQSGVSTLGLLNCGWATITTPSAATVPVTVKGATSQSANLQEWQDSAGTVFQSITSAGNTVLGLGKTITLNRPDDTATPTTLSVVSAGYFTITSSFAAHLNVPTTFFQYTAHRLTSVAGTLTVEAYTGNESLVLGASGSGSVSLRAGGSNQITASSTAATFAGNIQRSSQTGITASTTQTQGQGPLTKDINIVSTVANANDTVTLPTAVAGMSIFIRNNGANTLKIFPASGDNINGTGVDTAVTLATNTGITYHTADATNWYSV